MAREEAIEYFKFHRKIFCEDFLKRIPKNTISYQATLKEKEFYDLAIKSLETMEEFERAQILVGGRLNGRTYAYKCGLEDGKRKALEQTREEIEQITDTMGVSYNQYVSKIDVLQIIDKYKAESEDK